MAVTTEELNQAIADAIGEDALKQAYQLRISELKQRGAYLLALYETPDKDAAHIDAGALAPGRMCICEPCITEQLAGVVANIERLQAKLDGAKAAIIGEPIQLNRAQRRNGKR